MAISKTAGSKFWVSPTPVNPDAIKAMTDNDAKAFFAAISDWAEVEEIEDFGEHGDTSEAITFNSVSDGRVRKLKGSRNAGTKAIVVGRDPIDPGQIVLKAAEGTDFNYAFKDEYNDARSPNHSKSIEYFAGLVLSRPTNQGAENNVVRQTYNIDINTKIYEVASGNLTVPANILLPSIAGIVQEGNILTAIEGQWSNDPTSYTYQWKANGTNISGATGRTYTLVTGDVGDAITVQVTAVNAAGNSTPAVSGATAAVLAA